MPVKIHDIGSQIHFTLPLLEVDLFGSIGPGAKLDPAVLFVKGEPGVVDLAGGGQEVRWDPVDRAITSQTHLERSQASKREV